MAEFRMPSLGADMESGTLLEWLVHPGETVRRGQPMAVVDTDKAAIEIESFDDGVVEAFLVEPGQRVAVGAPLATITGAGGPRTAPEAAPAPRAEPVPRAEPAPRAEPVVAAAAGAPAQRPPVLRAAPRRLASPPVRHHAAELGVDLGTVTGTGRHGAVTRADVDRAAALHERVGARRRVSPYARRLAGELGVDVGEVAGSGPGGAVKAEDVLTSRPGPSPAARPAPRPGTASRTAIAALMSRAKREIPHYYVATTVDMHQVTQWLRKGNRERGVAERIIPAAVLLKATAVATRRFPELNGFWQDDGFVPAGGVHLGVAVTVRNGALVAPALHDTDELDVATIMRRLRDLVTRARSGRLTRAELTDPTLTVTDLGDQGVEEVIGVIYPPQVALLGVGRLVERPWAVDGLLGVRPVVRLTLSGDHRATDGYTGARFLSTIDDLLQHPEEL